MSEELARQVQVAIYAALGCTRINYSSGEQVDKAAGHIAQFVMPEIAAALSRARAMLGDAENFIMENGLFAQWQDRKAALHSPRPKEE